jgi:hypothetical protein
MAQPGFHAIEIDESRVNYDSVEHTRMDDFAAQSIGRQNTAEGASTSVAATSSTLFCSNVDGFVKELLMEVFEE